MGADEDAAARTGLDGLPLDTAVDAVVLRDSERDPDTVRSILGHVTIDGTVGWDAVDGKLPELAKVVSTPETRLEFAGHAVEDAAVAAEPHLDVDVVRSRLEGLRDRRDGLEVAVNDVAGRLNDIMELADDRDDLFAVARGIHAVTEDANQLHVAADELKHDAEQFERWLGSHDLRVEELDRDVADLEDSLDDLAAGIDGIVAGADSADPGERWFEAARRHCVLEVVSRDIRAELEGVLALADSGERPGVDEIETRLGTVEERLTTIEDTLDGAAEPLWRDRYGERLTEVDESLTALDTPIEWGEVQAILETSTEPTQ